MVIIMVIFKIKSDLAGSGLVSAIFSRGLGRDSSVYIGSGLKKSTCANF